MVLLSSIRTSILPPPFFITLLVQAASLGPKVNGFLENSGGQAHSPSLIGGVCKATIGFLEVFSLRLRKPRVLQEAAFEKDSCSLGDRKVLMCSWGVPNLCRVVHLYCCVDVIPIG